jgi:hypothetical protein
MNQHFPVPESAGVMSVYRANTGFMIVMSGKVVIHREATGYFTGLMSSRASNQGIYCDVPEGHGLAFNLGGGGACLDVASIRHHHAESQRRDSNSACYVTDRFHRATPF